MSNGVRLAVSGAGGGTGQSIIKALAETGYEAVALDAGLLGTGLYAAKTPTSSRTPAARISSMKS